MKYEVKWYDRYNQEKGETSLEAKGVEDLLNKLEIIAFDHNVGTVDFFIQNVRSPEGQYPALFGSLDSLLKRGFHDEAIEDKVYTKWDNVLRVKRTPEMEQHFSDFEHYMKSKFHLRYLGYNANERNWYAFSGKPEDLQAADTELRRSKFYVVKDAAINDVYTEAQLEKAKAKQIQLLKEAGQTKEAKEVEAMSLSEFERAMSDQLGRDDFEDLMKDCAVEDAENMYGGIPESKLRQSKDFKLKEFFSDLDEEKSRPNSVNRENNIQEIKMKIEKRLKEIKNVPNDVYAHDAAINDSYAIWHLDEDANNDEKCKYFEKEYGVKASLVNNRTAKFVGSKEQLKRLFKEEDIPSNSYEIHDAAINDSLVEPSKELIDEVKGMLEDCGFTVKFNGFTTFGRAEFKLKSFSGSYLACDRKVLEAYSKKLDMVTSYCDRKKSPATYNIACINGYISGYFHVDKTYIKDAAINDAFAGVYKNVYYRSEGDNMVFYQNGRQVAKIDSDELVKKFPPEKSEDSNSCREYIRKVILHDNELGTHKINIKELRIKSIYEIMSWLDQHDVAHEDKQNEIIVKTDANTWRMFIQQCGSMHGVKLEDSKIDFKKLAKIANLALKDAIVNPIGNVKYDEKVMKQLLREIELGHANGIVGNIQECLPKHGFKIEKLKLASDKSCVEVYWNYKGRTGYNMILENAIHNGAVMLAQDLASAIYHKDVLHDAALKDAWDIKPGAVFKDKRSGYDGGYWFIKVLKVENGVVYFQGMNRKKDGTFDKAELEKLPMEHFKDVLKNRYKQVQSIYDERLSPMTYKKLKELGYDSDDWKDLSQEQANEIISKGNKKAEKSGKKEEAKKEASKSPARIKKLLQTYMNWTGLEGVSYDDFASAKTEKDIAEVLKKKHQYDKEDAAVIHRIVNKGMTTEEALKDIQEHKD